MCGGREEWMGWLVGGWLEGGMDRWMAGLMDGWMVRSFISHWGVNGMMDW